MTTKKMGRPTKYTPELAEEICEAIATSSDGLTKLCKLNPHWPVRSKIMKWRLKHKDFGDKYARAKQNQVESLIDEILEIADDSSNDFVINENGKVVANHDHISRSKLRIDTRKWIAGKLAPRLYGDKPEIAIISPNDDFNILRDLTDKYLTNQDKSD